MASIYSVSGLLCLIVMLCPSIKCDADFNRVCPGLKLSCKDKNGLSCVDSCENEKDGSYQSCDTCGGYVECLRGYKHAHDCPDDTSDWDDCLKRCVPKGDSTTCVLEHNTNIIARALNKACDRVLVRWVIKPTDLLDGCGDAGFPKPSPFRDVGMCVGLCPAISGWTIDWCTVCRPITKHEVIGSRITCLDGKTEATIRDYVDVTVCRCLECEK